MMVSGFPIVLEDRDAEGLSRVGYIKDKEGSTNGEMEIVELNPQTP